MAPQPASEQVACHGCCQRLVAGVEEIAAVDRKLRQHPVLFQFGALEVQHDAVGEADLANAEARFAGVAGDRAGRAEIGIGKQGLGCRAVLAERSRHGLVPGSADGLVTAGRIAPALEPEQRIDQGNGFALQGGQDPLRRGLGDKGFQPFQRRQRTGRDEVFAQQGIDRFDQRGVGARIGRGRQVAGRCAQVGDLFGDLRLGKAAGQATPVFRAGSNQASAPFSVDRIDDEVGRPAIAEHVAGAEAGGTKRRRLATRHSLEAAIERPVADRAQYVLLALGDGIGFMQPGAVARNGDAFGQGGVDVDVGPAAVVGQYRSCRRARLCRGWLPRSEVLADRGLDGIGIEIADDDDGGLRRHIFALPESAQPFGRGGVQGFSRADGQAPGIVRAGIGEGDLVFEVAQREGIAVAPFRQDHAAFPFYRGLGNGQLARRFAHQHQRGVEQPGIVARQVEQVGGAVEAGLGVGIGAKGQSFAFQQAHHLALGHAGRAVEGHVLDKVGKAAFAVGFVQRACGDFHAHHAGACGGAVPADDIAQAIVQSAEAPGRIGRKVAGFKGPGGSCARRSACQRREAGRAGGQRKRRQRDQDTKTHAPCLRAKFRPDKAAADR